MAKRKISKKTQKKRIFKKADRHSVSKQKRPGKTYTGVFDASTQGYGFITADDGFALSDADIFVPAKHVKDAVSGDRVSFTLAQYNGRPEAHIVNILSRGTKTFIGVYKYIKRREGNRLKAMVLPSAP